MTCTILVEQYDILWVQGTIYSILWNVDCVKCCLVLTLYWIPAAPGGTILVEQYDTGIYTIRYWIWYIMDCLLNVMILTLHWIPVAPGGNPCNPRNQNKWVFKDREKGETGGFDSRLRWRYAIK